MDKVDYRKKVFPLFLLYFILFYFFHVEFDMVIPYYLSEWRVLRYKKREEGRSFCRIQIQLKRSLFSKTWLLHTSLN